MSFSYDPSSGSDVSTVRLMIADTSRSIPISGTCNVSGTAVSLLTGNPFSDTMGFIAIAGVQYVVASVTDEFNLVLAASAGVQSGAAWTSLRAIFSDEEVERAIYIESSQYLYTSGFRWPNGNKAPMPIQITSPRRAAAMLLDALAGNKSLLASVVAILDVKLGPEKAAQELRATAKQWRETEAYSGEFAYVEQVQDPFSARQRALNQLLRIEGGG